MWMLRSTSKRILALLARSSFLVKLGLGMLPDHRIVAIAIGNAGPGFVKVATEKLFSNLVRYSHNDFQVLRTVHYSGVASFSLRLNINEHTQCSYYFSAPNPDLLHLIAKGGGTFIDVGANVGFFTLFASHFFNNVVAFEPMPSTRRRLENNIGLNGQGNIVVRGEALANETGTNTLYVNPMNLGGSRLTPFREIDVRRSKRRDWDTHQVHVSRLDDILEDAIELKAETDVFIKIDVEGYEPHVISGGDGIIRRFRPAIYVEIGRRQDRLEQVAAALPQEYLLLDPLRGGRVASSMPLPLDVLCLPPEKISSYCSHDNRLVRAASRG